MNINDEIQKFNDAKARILDYFYVDKDTESRCRQHLLDKTELYWKIEDDILCLSSVRAIDAFNIYPVLCTVESKDYTLIKTNNQEYYLLDNNMRELSSWT